MSLLKEIPSLSGRLYAVGDIHGCQAELDTLLNHLETVENLTAADRVIFIGDFVDRGPASKEVVDRLLAFKSKFKNSIFLKGNHEDMLLDFLGFGGSHGAVYLSNGGIETLQSYGLDNDSGIKDLFNKMPLSHLNFFKSLDSLVVIGEYIFAHAGINPVRFLRNQVPEDVYWIREGFIDKTHSFNKVVVYGHTPYPEVMRDLPYKIGIDTGLVFGNKLSCIELMEHRCIQVAKGSSQVISSELNKLQK
jgi:serine/threonine protein phosphatase 1